MIKDTISASQLSKRCPLPSVARRRRQHGETGYAVINVEGSLASVGGKESRQRDSACYFVFRVCVLGTDDGKAQSH